MSGTYGHDIVCSAVSVLSITTANNLERMADISPITEMREGYLYVELPKDLTSEQEKTAQILLTAFVGAIKEVADEYSKFIQLKENKE
ncbi:hypothetical protein SAMN02745116_00949 [Pilibacter termitis]|uniref:Ribosomal processing cysteine protease Prp n=2 Tax=Pilibacter termitis TaxID=263852 RepID=A0A1T4M5Y4_9ENTE|nr:hypothetical protein SAMN02745116_00949 [Pilibacter termitis]